jgi:tellurite resistance protein TerC
MHSIEVPMWAWGLLGALMLVLVTIDLYAHRGDHTDSKRRALLWSVAWIATALAFNGWVAWRFGAEAGEQFLAAYLLEKSLSVDNLFVFLVIFAALKIPKAEQRRVLTWGILGALATRGLFIAAGAAVLERWTWVAYVFGALLVYTAAKLLREPESEGEPKLIGWLERHLPWTRERDGHHFFTRKSGKLLATPLLVALVAIELTDVVFAIDSVPAAFAVSDTPFIVYSSNVFAILGLRALYVVLAGALADLRYLRVGLAAVLAFAGVKMLVTRWVHIPPLLSVAVIILCIGAAVTASLVHRRRQKAPPTPAPPSSSLHELTHERQES